MVNEKSISAKKYFMMLSTECFALTSLILPSVLVGFAGENGFTVLFIVSFLLFLKAGWYLSCLRKKEISPEQLVKDLETRTVRGSVRILYGIRFFLHGLFLSLLLVSLIREVLLPGTGILFVLIPFYLLVYMTGGKKLSVRGRILEALFPCIFLPLILVLVLALFRMDYSFVVDQFPLSSWNGLESGGSLLYGIYGVLLFFEPVEFLLFLIPSIDFEYKNPLTVQKNTGRILQEQERKEAKRSFTKEKEVKRWGKIKAVTYGSCIFLILLNIMMYIASVGMFGTVRTGEKLWSALYIMQSVRLPGRFVERLDLLFLIFWIFSMFALFSAYMYYGIRFLFGEEDKRKGQTGAFVWLSLMAVFTLLIENTQNYFQFFLPYKMWVDFPLSVLIPALLYGKNKKVEKKGRKVAFLAIMCLLLVTGCSGKRDIEDKNYVMTLGLEPGEKKNYKIIYEIADLSSSGKDGGGGRAKRIVYEADSLKSAQDMDQARDDKKLDFGHLKAILIKKSLLEHQWKEKGEESLFEELKKMTEIAGTTLVFFTEEEVEKLMEIGEEKASSFGEYAEKMLSNQFGEESRKDTLAALLRDYSENTLKRHLLVFRTEEKVLLLEQQTFYPMGALAEEEILRFHLRASSDSSFDQSKKAAVKDRILPKIQSLLAFASTKEECVNQIETSLPKIESWVKEACRNENYSCEVTTYLCRETFPTKCYGGVFLPSGTYDALRIDLGQGQGGNWWCMLYPSLCMMEGVVEERKVEDTQKEQKNDLKGNLDSESQKEQDISSEKEAEFEWNGKKYYIKWKIADILKEIFGEKAS